MAASGPSARVRSPCSASKPPSTATPPRERDAVGADRRPDDPARVPYERIDEIRERLDDVIARLRTAIGEDDFPA